MQVNNHILQVPTLACLRRPILPPPPVRREAEEEGGHKIKKELDESDLSLTLKNSWSLLKKKQQKLMNKKTQHIKFSENKWTDYSFSISTKFITDNVIRNALSKFRSEIISSLSFYQPVSYPSNIKVLILFKVKSLNHQYKTITPLQIIDIEDFNLIYDIFIEY